MSCKNRKKLGHSLDQLIEGRHTLTLNTDNGINDLDRSQDNGLQLKEFINPAFMPRGGTVPLPVSVGCDINYDDGISQQNKISDRHYIGGFLSQLKLEAWTHELSFMDNDQRKSYLLAGVKSGFRILDCDASVPRYECDNYRSAMEPRANKFLSQLFKDERRQGKIVMTSEKPHCIHAIGAVPKKDDKYRPITDCRRPLYHSINNYMESTAQPFQYKSLDMVSDRISRGSYMSCTDIQAAYRSVHIAPEQWKYQGFKWTLDGHTSYYYDTRLSFGLRCAPFIFNEISEFIVECMARRGYVNVINYLDDYFCWGSSFQECANTQNALIQLLGQLGFQVAWSKCSSPSTRCTFLGVLIDSGDMTMSLPQQKLHKLITEIKFFHGRSRATVKQLRRLCGILSYASRVIRGGRTFSRRIIDHLKGLSPSTKRVRLTRQFHQDIQWWDSWASEFNGQASMIAHNYGSGLSICSDSSMKGYGVVHGTRWCAGHFNADSTPKAITPLREEHYHWVNLDVGHSLSINILELVPIWLACVLWGSMWTNQQVICWTDNTQVMAAINRGTSANAKTMNLLRDIFWYSVVHNFHLAARHVPGSKNVIPDFLSRIDDCTEFIALSECGLCCCRGPRASG